MAEAEQAQSTADIQGSWAGGHDGMQITNIVLDAVEVRVTLGPARLVLRMLTVQMLSTQGLLSPIGCFYLVAVKENDPLEICRRMLQEHELRSEVSAISRNHKL